MNNAVVMTQRKSNVIATECELFQCVFKVREFCLFCTQKLTSCWRIKKQVTRFNRGACWVGCRADFRLHITPFRFHLPGFI